MYVFSCVTRVALVEAEDALELITAQEYDVYARLDARNLLIYGDTNLALLLKLTFANVRIECPAREQIVNMERDGAVPLNTENADKIRAEIRRRLDSSEA